MRHRVIGDVPAIEAYRFALEEIVHRLVGGRRIGKASGGQRHSRDEVFVQLTLESEPNAYSGAVAVVTGGASAVLLEVILTAHPNVSRPAQTAQGVLEASEALLLLLLGERVVSQRGLHIGEFRVEFVDGILRGGRRGNPICPLLGVRSSLLCLLQLLLCLLKLLVGLLQLLVGLL